MSEATKAMIQTELVTLEQVHGVRILLAVESGSRAWGFESKDSDWDVRFVYARPLTWYLSVHERRDVIEIPTDGVMDYSGWDVQKALFQTHRGNPALFEWLRSPIVYMANPAFTRRMVGLMDKYFNPRSAIYHYLHMANGNFREYLRGETVRLKKYFYVVRPLLACQWIERTQQMPPVEFARMLEEERKAEGSEFPHDAVEDLLRRKMAGEELDEGPRIEQLNRWIVERISYFQDMARTTAKVSAAPDDLDEFLFNTVLGRV